MEFNLVKLIYNEGNITVEGYRFRETEIGNISHEMVFSENFGEDYLSALISVSKIAKKNEAHYLTVEMSGFPDLFPGQTVLTDF